MYKKLKKLIIQPKLFFHDYYRKKISNCNFSSIQNKTILYESYHGKSMSCNPYAIFTYLLHHNNFKDYKHIWILNDLTNYKVAQYNTLPNVIFIKRNSRKYRKYLCISKYLINNTSFSPFFSKNKEQIYINTWHGTPIKSLGKDTINIFAGAANITRNFLQADYLIMPNTYTSEIMLKSHDIDTLYAGKVCITGYPRIDKTFISDTKKEEMKKSLGIDEKMKVILYAPTYRGDYNNPFEKEVEKNTLLEKILEKYSSSFVILYNPHYFENHIDLNREGNIIGYADKYETSEILGIIDILITDYSSVVFDYMHLKKPIIYYAYDEEEYKKQRGTYIDLDILPGKKCHLASEVLEEINKIVYNKDTSRIITDIEKQFTLNSDGNATKRVVESIFFNHSDCIVPIKKISKKKLLFYAGGFAKNGITSSITSLLSSLNYNLFDVYLIFDKKNKQEHIERFIGSINFDNIHILYYIGTKDIVNQNRESHYKKEAYRLFGDASFDVAIEASGYGEFWSGVFKYVDTKERWIYLHNDMIAESQLRPKLANYTYLFELYETTYDKLVCVSQSSYEQNLKAFPSLEYKMIYLNNTINVNKIKALSTFSQVEKDVCNFINIGRYDQQKGQDRLILAFAQLEEEYPDIRLYIVGYGPMYNELYMMIKSLHLTHKVFLTGMLENPFPLLKKCDCMVMSSHYEGQGIVILESLVLDVPCISTNISGPNSILDDAFLFEDSQEGIYQGMKAFLLNELPPIQFNFDTYNKESLLKFENEINKGHK